MRKFWIEVFSKMSEQVNCKICGSSEMEVPMLQARYAGEFFWICSRCMPTLIHKPEQLAGILRNADKIPAAEHQH